MEQRGRALHQHKRNVYQNSFVSLDPITPVVCSINVINIQSLSGRSFDLSEQVQYDSVRAA